jgi:hypothetical protein
MRISQFPNSDTLLAGLPLIWGQKTKKNSKIPQKGSRSKA